MKTVCVARTPARGFTLMEMMAVVAIVGILTAIAIPNYTQYVLRAKRTEGKAALLKTQGALERYYTVNNTYTQDLTALGASAFSGDNAASSAYTIAVVPGVNGIAVSYTINATPVGQDALCGVLSVDYQNTKTASGTGTQSQCW